jgi:hypothetical protein
MVVGALVFAAEFDAGQIGFIVRVGSGDSWLRHKTPYALEIDTADHRSTQIFKRRNPRIRVAVSLRRCPELKATSVAGRILRRAC